MPDCFSNNLNSLNYRVLAQRVAQECFLGNTVAIIGNCRGCFGICVNRSFSSGDINCHSASEDQISRLNVLHSSNV